MRYLLFTGALCLVWNQYFIQKTLVLDGLGYLSYLINLFYVGDFTGHSLLQQYPEIDVNKIWLIELSDGKYLTKYPCGVALLVLPFYTLAYLFGEHLHPYGAVYDTTVKVAAFFWFCAGLYCFKRFVQKLAPDLVPWALLGLVLATHLPYYVISMAGFSHAYSFFALSLFALLWLQWKEDPTPRRAVALGCAVGLVCLLRPGNALGLLPFFLLRNLRQSWWRIGLAAALTFSPQMLYWWYVSGTPFLFNTYLREPGWIAPDFWAVWFSVDKGYFFWTPLALFGMVGLWKVCKPMVFAVGVMLAVYPFWWDRVLGMGYGYRGLAEFSGLVALGAAYFVRGRRRLALAVILFLGLLNWERILRTWQGHLPTQAVGWETYWGAFLETGGEG